VAQVRFTGWTDDHRLRHPVFQGLREDKPARDVKREEPQPASADSAKPVAAGVVISHPDRVVYPEQRLTKLDVARYYERAAGHLLPYIANRPLSLLRCPDGREGPCFYQKNWGKSGDAVKTLRIAGKSGSANAPVIADARGLLRLIQNGALELHPWGSRTPSIENPDVCVFDLDPAPDVPWPDLAAAARALRERLQSKGLESFLKTTGGKGLHVVLPLQGRTTWEELKTFAKSMAVQMTRDHPDLYTATMSKQARRGRIFIDWLRNGRGATAVAPYSTRARAHAPIAAPLTWEELGSIDRADAFTISTIAARLEKDDPWKGYFQVRQRLPQPPG
jgi:bifunctional non-homologous end joining protein LigD